MKSFKFIAAGIILAIVCFFSLFILEMTKTPKLAEQKHERERVISEAKAAKKKLEKFRKNNTDLENTDKYVKKMVLADETAVLAAIREISILARENGLKDSELNYINPDNPATMGQAGGADINPDLARTMGLTKAKAVFVVAKFKSDFASLLNYLKDVYALKTVFSVEQISISRDEKIMPLQDIYLLLAVYMY
jgi:hypothetical protein